MTLAHRQRAFLAEIAADDNGPAPTSAGMAIYRNTYRARLMGALETSFARTRTWVGEDAFMRAASHYILTHPPSHWSLDDYGAGLPQLYEQLFRADPDAQELCWLEWQLQKAFAAPNKPMVTASDLASADLRDEDWDGLCFEMAAGFAARLVRTDCAALWRALIDGVPPARANEALSGSWLIVWRKDGAPCCRLVAPEEWMALGSIFAGRPLGVVGETTDPELLGPWLANWISDGLISALITTR